MDYTTVINQSGTLTYISSTDYSVELGFIVMAVALSLLVYYKLNKLLGLLLTLSVGVTTLFYGSTNNTGYIFGIVGWVVIAIGIMMTINFLFEPVSKR